MKVLVSTPFSVRNDLAFVRYCNEYNLDRSVTDGGQWVIQAEESLPSDEDLDKLAPILEQGEVVVFTGVELVAGDRVAVWSWSLAWNGEVADREKMNQWVRERFLAAA